MSDQPNSRGMLIAALIVGASFLIGSIVIAGALDRATEQFDVTTKALGERPPAAAPSGNDRPSRPRGPDREKRNAVEVGDAPFRGPQNAEITIVEWSDFQCPFCSRVTPTLAKIQEEYGSKVRIVFKHLPLPNHSEAPAAHAASEAAHRQGKFWEMHDKIFESPRDLAGATFERYASELGLDVERFKRDAASKEVRDRLAADVNQANSLGVSGTPAFFINGRFLSGAQPFAKFKVVIDDVLAENS